MKEIKWDSELPLFLHELNHHSITWRQHLPLLHFHCYPDRLHMLSV